MPIMATVTHLSEQEYRELVLTDDHLWELWDGILLEKPPMSMVHNRVAFFLGHLLQAQLDRGEYRITVNGDRARLSSGTFYIPDVMVIPAAYQDPIDPRGLGIYADPLPLVVEIWSPSTGEYDFETKLAGYRARGDLEIWCLHPYNRTLTVWRRQPDGSYADEHYTGGIVAIASLPGVTIDLDALLDG
jgi:Uma2 family endonuclease